LVNALVVRKYELFGEAIFVKVTLFVKVTFYNLFDPQSWQGLKCKCETVQYYFGRAFPDFLEKT
jgi:hypothetical protein